MHQYQIITRDKKGDGENFGTIEANTNEELAIIIKAEQNEILSITKIK